jgi:hypothetical protein
MKAFPYMHKHPTSGQTTESGGMDLRDWFAGLAMQGMMVNNPYPACENVAKTAYQMADVMMLARKELSDE